MQPSIEIGLSQSPQYALDALHALPCGCVAGVYKSQPFDLAVVSVEARGPHCLYPQHQSGSMLGMATDELGRLSR